MGNAASMGERRLFYANVIAAILDYKLSNFPRGDLFFHYCLRILLRYSLYWRNNSILYGRGHIRNIAQM